MSTRTQIRANVRQNLADVGITFYSESEINDSLQDAYNEIVAKTLCHIKQSTALNWSAVVGNYIDFETDFAITDYLGTYAIFNNLTNWWLRDDISIRDLDRIRRDWEQWRGQPQFWVPHSLKYIIVAPINLPGTGTFTPWYYAKAPTMTIDSDVPVIAADQHTLLEYYATADLLESAEERVKAQAWWNQYEPQKEEYKTRCHNLAKHDLLLRV